MSKRLVRVIALAWLLAGCWTPPNTALPPDPSFEGIATMNAGAQEVRLLFIHGMGEAQPGDVLGLLRHLSHALGMAPLQPDETIGNTIEIPRPELIAAPAAPADAQLYTYRFQKVANGQGPSRMTVRFLLWSPMTQAIKDQVLGEPGHSDWAPVTKFSKGFLQTHLSDVVLFGGQYRTVLRLVVEETLCRFVGGSWNGRSEECPGGDLETPSVVITHSLGGYMLVDAAVHLRGKFEKQVELDAAAKTLAGTRTIFMLANQLALLDLADMTSFPRAATTAEALAVPAPSAASALTRFMRSWHVARRQQAPGGSLAPLREQPAALDEPLRIVAVSDPNDLLSYVVSSREVPPPDQYFNLFWANTPVVLGVAADPYAAHLGYLTSDEAMQMIACGMAKGTIRTCGQ